MTDLNSLLNAAAGGHLPATSTDVAADLARGRSALRSRRVNLIGRGAFALTLVAGVVVAQNGGAFGGSPARDSVVAAPTMAFVAYTGAQPEGFSVATVPAGWRIQGVNEYSLVIVPPGNDKPMPTQTELSSFEGKLLVSLESLDATEAPTGTPVSVGGIDGFVDKQNDGYGQLRWTNAAGQRMYVQWPVDAGWTDREVADFAAGIKVLSAAKATRG